MGQHPFQAVGTSPGSDSEQKVQTKIIAGQWAED